MEYKKKTLVSKVKEERKKKHGHHGNVVVVGVVLGKFGLKPIQTQFEPNRNRVSSFRFGKFLPKPNGLVSGFGLLKFHKRFQIWFKPQTVCTYNLFFIATVNCFEYLYIYYINFEVYLLILYLIYL